MSGVAQIDWANVQEAADAMAGNWRKFESFAWSRGFDLEDAKNWMIHYTSHRDSGLLAKSNEHALNMQLKKYADNDDPDVVFESHSHWAVGYIDGFSLRVFRPDGTITDAFREFCAIKEQLENYPLLDEEDYSRREHEATLENYASEVSGMRNGLPEGWESQIYIYFSDHGLNQYVENRDDQGGYAPREMIVEALSALGLIEAEPDDPIIV